MGVIFLTKFMKKQNLYQPMNIRVEIEEHRRKTGDAIIIIDMMGFLHIFGEDNIDLDLGGRQSIYLQEFRHFLLSLKRAGATMVFFWDGQLQSDRNDVWCQRRDQEFIDSYDIITQDNPQCKRRFGCKIISKSLLKLIEDEQLGNVIISTQVACDSAIAKYAVENHVLAIIASDSDFLIFEGDFQWWDSNSIRLTDMNAKRFDRLKLRQLLKLSTEQMKYLATIAGCDYTNSLAQRNYRNFFEIANFCRTIQSGDLTEGTYQRIGDYIRLKNDENAIIATSIKSYSIDFEIKPPTDRMDQFFSSNVLIYAFKNQQIFQYDVNFLDFKLRNENYATFLNNILEVLRKLGGILLKNEHDQKPLLYISTKYSLNEKYTMKTHQPIYPQVDVNIEAIFFNKTNDDIKWNLILWSLGINSIAKSDLINLPERYILTVLTLTVLHKANEINTLEADAFLTTQYDIIDRFINLKAIQTDPSSVDKNTIRICQLFNKTTSLLWDCFSVCGLKRLIQLDWFDGPYFNQLLTQFQQSNDIYNKRLENVRNYRLYATNQTF